jgi:phosphoserine phosphatase
MDASLEPERLQGKLANATLFALGQWRWIDQPRAGEWALNLDDANVDDIAIAQEVAKLLGDEKVDFAVQPNILRQKKLLVSDMDSTLIGQECIDELANLAGIGAQVAEITERAMRGELEFEGALRERVGLLKDLPEAALEQVWSERITLTPGADWVMSTLGQLNALRVVVSGGFTYFTQQVCDTLGMDNHFSNTLRIEDGKLQGTVADPILGKQEKLQMLLGEVQALGISPQESIAIGDGANDLPMLQAAGLGVAYHAKPMVEAQVSARIRVGDLTSVLFFMGIPQSEWVNPQSEL